MNFVVYLVMIARGTHLFPYRTQKLSLFTPMVFGWQRPERVGSRQLRKENTLSIDRVFFSAQNYMNTKEY